MKLQQLFQEKIIGQSYIDLWYPGHASDVWIVKTTSGKVVVRTSRFDKPAGPFWLGCHNLFGISPQDVFSHEIVNSFLGKVCPIPVPRVTCKAIIEEKQYVVLEYMQGKTLRNFYNQPPSLLIQLGEALAQIHKHRFGDFGNPVGTIRYSLNQFHTRVVDTMRLLVTNFYHEDYKYTDTLEAMCLAAIGLPLLDYCSYIMIDMDARQFLTDENQLTAVVDTEAYVIGPRELDLIALEYCLDREGSLAFKYGYSSILEMPNLSSARSVYRYLLRLLCVQGSVDLNEWMEWPILID